jgi:hypothetical protein
MNLYLLTQAKHSGYDTFSHAVVCAKDEAEARLIFPDPDPCSGPIEWRENHWHDELCFDECANDSTDTSSANRAWAPPDELKVIFIGLATDAVTPGVVCSSYHAG